MFNLAQFAWTEEQMEVRRALCSCQERRPYGLVEGIVRLANAMALSDEVFYTTLETVAASIELRIVGTDVEYDLWSWLMAHYPGDVIRPDQTLLDWVRDIITVSEVTIRT